MQHPLTTTKTLILSLMALAFFFALSGELFAEIYRWVDDKGVTHYTDEPDKIPARYKEKSEEVEKKTPALQVSPTPGTRNSRRRTTTPRYKEPVTQELYNGHPAVYWRTLIRDKRQQIKELNDEKREKKTYMDEYSRGRREGNIYTETEYERYLKFEGDINEIDERVEELGKELDKIIRDAKYYGVPKEYRE